MAAADPAPAAAVVVCTAGVGQQDATPADNLFTFEPWKSYAAELGVGVPHNPLVSDLILENYGWKSLIVEAVRDGARRTSSGARAVRRITFPGSRPAFRALPTLDPLLRAAAVAGLRDIHLAPVRISSIGMYLFARALRLRPSAAIFAAVAYTFSGFMIVSVNFTMFIAAAAWLPYILAAIETMVHKQEEKGMRPSRQCLTSWPGRQRWGCWRWPAISRSSITR